MYICIWSDWFGENLYDGTKPNLYKYIPYSTLFLHWTTFSQIGPDGASEEEWGVNYRALNDLFHITQTRGGIFQYDISVQMVEIYNEQVRDLLSSDGQKKYPLFIFLGFLFDYRSNSDYLLH